MKIGFFQMNPYFGQVQRNLQIVRNIPDQDELDLLVLPEFFNTGYLFTSSDEVNMLSEKIPNGITTQALIQQAQNHHLHIVAGIPERSGSSFYNSAVLVYPDGRTDLYRKTHLFDREKLFFKPGNTGFNVFSINGIKLGIMICFDWFFPESARTLALKGAEIIAHPSNLVLPFCPNAMVTRCLENHVFAITCNRTGTENRNGMNLKYIGNSRIIDPSGNILSTAENESNILKTVTIEPHQARDKNLNSRNNLFSDRHPSFYSAIYSAID